MYVCSNRFTIEIYGFVDGLRTFLAQAAAIALKDSEDSPIDDNGKLENESEIHVVVGTY